MHHISILDSCKRKHIIKVQHNVSIFYNHALNPHSAYFTPYKSISISDSEKKVLLSTQHLCSFDK